MSEEGRKEKQLFVVSFSDDHWESILNLKHLKDGAQNVEQEVKESARWDAGKTTKEGSLG